MSIPDSKIRRKPDYSCPSCPARNYKPVTKTIVVKRTVKKTRTSVKRTTITVTATATTSPAPGRNLRLVKREDTSFETTSEEWVAGSDEGEVVAWLQDRDESEGETSSDHGLFARNLCPVCPKGVKFTGNGKANGRGTYCCPGKPGRLRE